MSVGGYYYSSHNAIGGGHNNQIRHCGSSNTIIGGAYNVICLSNRSSVVGGYGLSVSSYNNVTQFPAINKSSSSFKISHPDPEKYPYYDLVHKTVESPTAGDNIYRYEVETKDGQATIELPSYYKFLNENDQVWITPKDNFGNGYGEVNEKQTEINIKSDIDGKFYVLLIGTRKDELARRSWRGVEDTTPSNIVP